MAVHEENPSAYEYSSELILPSTVLPDPISLRTSKFDWTLNNI